MSRDNLVVEGLLGRIELTRAAMTSLVVHAAESAPGVRVRRPRRGVDVAIDGDTARVNVGIAAPGDAVLPAVGEDVQRRIVDAFRATAGLTATVDVAVEELQR